MCKPNISGGGEKKSVKERNVAREMFQAIAKTLTNLTNDIMRRVSYQLKDLF